MTDQTATTTPVTTTALLARYDATERSRAASLGRPADRTDMPGILDGRDSTIGISVRDATAIFTGPDGHLYLLDLREKAAVAEPLTYVSCRHAIMAAYDLGDTSTNVHNALIFADADTLRRATKMTAKWSAAHATQESRMIARLMEFRASLPTSAYTPVLTTALASRYWLPAGPSTDDLGAWDVAFGHGHPFASQAAFLALIAKARDGQTHNDLVKATTKAERFAARSGQYASDHSANAAFSYAGTMSDCYSALVTSDPLLLARNMVAGLVAEFKIFQTKSREVHAHVTHPGKLREGSRVIAFAAGSVGKKISLSLLRLDLVNDQMIAVFKQPYTNNGGIEVYVAAERERHALFGISEPFLSLKRSPANRRWTGGDERSLHVDIPVDIALAGAPSA